jgi:hypothetical protein
MERTNHLLIPLLATLPLFGACGDDSATGDDDVTNVGGNDTGGSTDIGNGPDAGDTSGGSDASIPDATPDDAGDDTTTLDDVAEDTTEADASGGGGGDLPASLLEDIAAFCEQYAECDAEAFAAYWGDAEECAERTADYVSSGLESAAGYNLDGCEDATLEYFSCYHEYREPWECTEKVVTECDDQYANMAETCEFTYDCETGEVLDWEVACDGTEDCPGGEDEAYCDY